MKASFGLAAVALALSGSVNAAEICGPPRIDVGNTGRNGVVSTYVAHDPDGTWTIKHTLADGTVVDRSLQYVITDYTSRNAMRWRGTLMRNPSMVMIGEAMKLAATGQPTYNEWLYHNGQVIMHSEALCQFDTSPPKIPQPVQSAPPPRSNLDADAARDKVIKEVSAQYDECIHTQMKEVVPYSNESGEVLSQVIVTNCHPQEQRVIDLVIAIYGTSRSDAERIIKGGVENRKSAVLADIVTFRAELAKSLLSQHKPTNDAPKADDASKKDVGL